MPGTSAYRTSIIALCHAMLQLFAISWPPGLARIGSRSAREADPAA